MRRRSHDDWITVPSMTIVPIASVALPRVAALCREPPLVVGRCRRHGRTDRVGAGAAARRRAASTTRSRPTRIFDTRGAGINDAAPLGAKPRRPPPARRSTSDVARPGRRARRGRRREPDVLAVVVNITVDQPDAGRLPVDRSPTGSRRRRRRRSSTSMPGENVPNLAVVGAGYERRARRSTLVMPSGAGTAHVLVDVFGWFSTSDYPDTDDAAPGSSPSAPAASSTPASRVPAGWAAVAPLGRRAADTADPRRRRRAAGGHRHRAERPERHRRDGQHHRRRQRRADTTFVSAAPGDVRRRRAADHVEHSTCARPGQGQPGDRAGRRRRQHPALQRLRQHPSDRRRAGLPVKRRRRRPRPPAASCRSMSRSARSTPASRRSAPPRSASAGRGLELRRLRQCR